MARITIDPALFQAQLMLRVCSMIQKVRAENARACNIWDYTRAGADFTALGVALGCSAADAATLYSRFRAIEATMNGPDFVNLSEVDQG